jgi:iron(III) transport system ATP-binding protein
MQQLELTDVHVRYGDHTVLRGVSLSLKPGEIGCLLGASGCGKTTALRAIAGFERVHAGQIQIRGDCVARAGHHTEPRDRRVGMVFQDHALFAHLSVGDNLAFGLRHGQGTRRPREADLRARVTQMLELVGLAGFESRMPHELSGGQQQRVALARALAPNPELLLLDEPFSSLDAAMRERLAQDIRRVLKATGTTALFVTHDQHEAFALADQIGVIHEGRLVQWASGYELYHRPANQYIAEFIGEGVLLRAEVCPGGQIQLGEDFGDSTAQISAQELPASLAGGAPCNLLIRPDDITHDDAAPTVAKVIAKAFRGAQFLYRLELRSGREVLALVPSHHNHALGEWIGIQLTLDHAIAFPLATPEQAAVA